MKNLLFLTSCLGMFLSQSAFAFSLSECDDLIRKAETEETANSDLYDSCEFNNETIVWEKWAPFASHHQLKKALYEICVRYPQHIYHDSYCEKSAALNYGPALALKAKDFLKKGEESIALKWATKAIQTKELSEEQTGSLLEEIGVYYYKSNNPKYTSYLEQAALRRSALANHMLGILNYENFVKQPSEKTEQAAFQYIWRAILLGCPNAEENLGLFHLARQEKITQETAKLTMHSKLKSCNISLNSEEEIKNQEKMYQCQCKTALTNEKRFKEKPYLLLRVENDVAVLKDSSKTEYQVRINDNLPNQGRVTEIHKTAIVLTYPNDRLVLNLYKDDECVPFCRENNINENLKPDEMKKQLIGDTSVTIQPYHLSFTPQECETLLYYAPSLLDTKKFFVGKEECSNPENKNPSKNTILDHITNNKIIQTNSTQNEEPKQTSPEISEQAKKRLKSFGEELIQAK